LLPTALSEPVVSKFPRQEPGLVLPTYILQHSVSQWSASSSSKNRVWSCPLTFYNTQRASGQQLPHLRTVVDPAHLQPTTLSEPVVSNFPISEPYLVLPTYNLQHSASQWSAISPSQNRG